MKMLKKKQFHPTFEVKERSAKVCVSLGRFSRGFGKLPEPRGTAVVEADKVGRKL